MSNTPRTDECERLFSTDGKQNPQHRLTVLCRTLERELAEVREQRDHYITENKKLLNDFKAEFTAQEVLADMKESNA